MNLKEILQFNFTKQNYDGIIEIYPQKATNSMVLDKVLLELQKEYDLVKVFDGWIRAYRREVISNER